jgi:hypothetical protein
MLMQNQPSSSSGQSHHQNDSSRSLTSPAITNAMGREDSMQISNILHDIPGGNGGRNDTVDNDMDGNLGLSALPFEGYNVEELWNWMLLTDSGGDLAGPDVLDWADNHGFEDH